MGESPWKFESSWPHQTFLVTHLRFFLPTCALRSVSSTDGMMADIYTHGSALLAKAAARIVNEMQGINRVVYYYTSKSSGTIEWE